MDGNISVKTQLTFSQAKLIKEITMTAANSTESMLFINNFTTWENNSTASTASFNGSTSSDYEAHILDSADDWTTRLLSGWYEFFWYNLGLISSCVIIYLSLFDKKYINGDYKWFILNQAVASFCSSSGGWLTIVVIFVVCGQSQFFEILYSSDCPLWMTILNEVINRLWKQGTYAQMTTLLVTVLNRFVAIAFPGRYANLMTPRRIILYCISSYLVLVLTDDYVLRLLSFSLTLYFFITEIYDLAPWILSTILSVLLYCILFKRQRNMTNVLDQQSLKESRTVLRVVLIETVFIFFNRIFTSGTNLLYFFGISDPEVILNSWIIYSLFRLYLISLPVASAFPCLTILVIMRPYREAVLSYFSPIKKCFKCLTKQVTSNKVSVQTVNANRTLVISVRSVPSTKNNGAIVQD